MRFKIPLVEFNKVAEAVPALKEWSGQLSKEQEHYLIRGGEMSGVKQSEFALNRVCQVNFSKTFNEWINQYKQEPFKIYSFLSDDRIWKNDYLQDKYDAPLNVDFKTQLKVKLHKKMLPKINGAPTSVEYYEIKRPKTDANGGQVLDTFSRPVFEYENLIARVDFELVYDSFGFILEKKAWLKWYRVDGVISEESKNIGRVYDPVLDYELRVEEGKLRRESIINGIQLPVLDMLKQVYSELSTLELLTKGRSFLDNYDEEFRDFIDKSKSISDPASVDFGKKEIWVKIRDHSVPSDDEWLDADLGEGKTARQYILDELDI